MGSSGASGGGSGALTLIAEQLLAVDGPVDFQNIPQTFRHLWLVGSVLRAGSVNAISEGVAVRFNNDATLTAYLWVETGILNSAASNGAVAAGGADRLFFGRAAIEAVASETTPIDLRVFAYREPTFKSIIGHTGIEANAGGASNRMFFGEGWWRNVAAINRLTLLGSAAQTDFGAGSRVSLYGLG